LQNIAERRRGFLQDDQGPRAKAVKRNRRGCSKAGQLRTQPSRLFLEEAECEELVEAEGGGFAERALLLGAGRETDERMGVCEDQVRPRNRRHRKEERRAAREIAISLLVESERLVELDDLYERQR